jgi:hypothetical protein
MTSALPGTANPACAAISGLAFKRAHSPPLFAFTRGRLYRSYTT